MTNRYMHCARDGAPGRHVTPARFNGDPLVVSGAAFFRCEGSLRIGAVELRLPMHGP